MKAMTKTQLACYAGVCVDTFTNWLKPFKEELEAMGYRKGQRIIPPNVVAWMCQRSPMHSMKMPGSRYDIGNLESYEFVQKNYKGITR